MTGPYFVDTNVLVYTRDASEPKKRSQAYDWLTFLWQTRQGRLNMQVMQKYYQVVTRRLCPGLDPGSARDDIRDLMIWQPKILDLPVLELAWVAEARYQLSWWDALIVGAAQRLGCRYLLSEDLQNGQDLDGVVVANPFTQPVPTT